MNILQELQTRLASALAEFTAAPAEFAAMVKPAGDSKFGDFQANCAMPLAKRLGQNPRELAQKIVERLAVSDLCAPPEVAGPGFINFTLRRDWLESQLTAIRRDERLGVPIASWPRRFVIDFSSPNVAKPMHVGHLRSTVIGSAIDRLLRFLGHHVQSDNHIGDWGTQFGMILYGYKNFVDQKAYATQPVAELARLYRLVNQLTEYHAAVAELPTTQAIITEKEREIERLTSATISPDQKKEHDKSLKKLRKELSELREEYDSLRAKIERVDSTPPLRSLADQHPNIARLSRDETAKLHAGDAENRRLWHELLPHCLQELNIVYDRLGIDFDMTLGESFYDPWLPDIVPSLAEHGLVTDSDGAKCVFLEAGKPPFIVQKADGAFTYATTDLATIQYRVETLKADEILYVVDFRQGSHFQMLFETARRWKYRDVPMKHIPFGTVMGQDGKPYKTRTGEVASLIGLIDGAVAKALDIIVTNDDAKSDGPELSETERREIAEIVGIGGIKYADLKHNRESDYIFDEDKMLAMTGDTATYMQYSYARTCGILRRGGLSRDAVASQPGSISLDHPAERQLALQMCRFQESLEAAAAEAKPNYLTQYLLDLSSAFSTFFDQCPVLKAEDAATKSSRLKLVELTGRFIKQGLDLLGIGVREQM